MVIGLADAFWCNGRNAVNITMHIHREGGKAIVDVKQQEESIASEFRSTSLDPVSLGYKHGARHMALKRRSSPSRVLVETLRGAPPEPHTMEKPIRGAGVEQFAGVVGVSLTRSIAGVH